MPYVITTTRQISSLGIPLVDEQSRVAVATLEEARDSVATAIEGSPAWIGTTYPFNGLDGLVQAAETLPESGGTVGPLPDGTIIEVSRVSWLELDGSTGMGEAEPIEHATHVSILAAFNAS